LPAAGLSFDFWNMKKRARIARESEGAAEPQIRFEMARAETPF